MIKKITVKYVSSLAPEAKTYDVRDTDISGFALRVRPTGTMTYLLFYRNDKGQKRTYTIGKGLTAVQARDIAQLKYAEVAQGIDINERDKAIKVKADKQKASTLKSFIDNIYKDWLLSNRKSGKDGYSRLNRSFAGLANKQLESITKWDIQSWRKQRKESGTSDYTLKRDLSELKAMLVRAKDWGFIETNPLYDFKYGKLADNKVDRYLTDVERGRLYNALNDREQELMAKRQSGNEWRKERGYELMSDFKQGFVDHLKPVVILALNTGLRRGELLQLSWENVNLSLKQLTVTSITAKSKKARYIPLNHEALDTLRVWHKQTGHNRYVFSGKGGQPLKEVKHSWISLLERAGITNFRFHDMRHDFASQLVMKGADLYVVKDLLGHSTIQMTERYAHLAPKQLEDAVNLLNA
jgi:integrase